MTAFVSDFDDVSRIFDQGRIGCGYGIAAENGQRLPVRKPIDLNKRT